MPESLLSDELLRSLIATGQVDVLVGVPTFNNAATIGELVRAGHLAFSRQFGRQRTLLLNVDGGSDDGTPDIARRAAVADAGTMTATQELRTQHRISAPYHGIPGKAGALRLLFTVAELLQAKAVVVLDADYTGITPDGVASLIRPVLREEYDFVSPVYPRRPLEAPLVTQLVRPLMRAAYARQLREPVTGDFGCSLRFAQHCAGQDVWERDLSRNGIDVWLTATALAGSFRCCEAALGMRTHAPRDNPPGLPVVFAQVVGALFECLDLHAAEWLDRTGSETVPLLGAIPPGEDGPPPLDVKAMGEAYRTGLRDLEPVLGQILSPATHAALRAAATGDAYVAGHDVWVHAVFEAAAAYHGRVMPPEHVVSALLPIYLGRAAGLVCSIGESCRREDHDRSVEALGDRFEEAKPYLVERWKAQNGR